MDSPKHYRELPPREALDALKSDSVNLKRLLDAAGELATRQRVENTKLLSAAREGVDSLMSSNVTEPFAKELIRVASMYFSQKQEIALKHKREWAQFERNYHPIGVLLNLREMGIKRSIEKDDSKPDSDWYSVERKLQSRLHTAFAFVNPRKRNAFIGSDNLPPLEEKMLFTDNQFLSNEPLSENTHPSQIMATMPMSSKFVGLDIFQRYERAYRKLGHVVYAVTKDYDSLFGRSGREIDADKARELVDYIQQFERFLKSLREKQKKETEVRYQEAGRDFKEYGTDDIWDEYPETIALSDAILSCESVLSRIARLANLDALDASVFFTRLQGRSEK